MTAIDIVRDAYREGNLVPLDATTGIPVTTAGQDTEGLALLNRFIASLLGFELGEFALDWPVPPSTTSPIPARYPILPKGTNLKSDQWPYPPGNVQIITSLVSEPTIYLTQDPDDGARIQFSNIGDASTYNLTIDGNGRLVNGAATVVATPGTLDGQIWLYRADLSDWVAYATLTETDESPFPTIYDDLLSAATFMRLAPRYGRSVSNETAQTFARLMKRMKTQYRQRMPEPSDDPNGFFLPASDMNRRGFNFGSGLLS